MNPYIAPFPADAPQGHPACDGHWLLFGALIDAPANPWHIKDAADLCGGCPIRDRCLADNHDEDWAKSVTIELVRRVRQEKKQKATDAA